jgi:PD-(D/E)XK nuclease superfamily
MGKISLAADASQIADFMKCPRLWYYKYIRNLEFSGPRNLAFDKGTLVHALMDYYYRRMPDNSIKVAGEAVQEFRKNVPKLGVEKKDVDLIIARFQAYSQMYGVNDFQPLVVNGEPQVEVGFSVPIVDTNYFYFVLEGRIDLITKNEIFVDHKTQSRKYDHYKHTPQFLTYALATGLSQGCVNYFSLADLVNKDTFRRQVFVINSEIRERWKQKLIQIFYKMAECKRTGNFEMNEVSCQDNFGICQYAKLDEETDNKFREQLIKLQYREREAWQPWRLNGANHAK